MALMFLGSATLAITVSLLAYLLPAVRDVEEGELSLAPAARPIAEAYGEPLSLALDSTYSQQE